MFGLFRKNQATHSSPRSKAPEPHHWQSILRRADGSHLDATAALNVKLICELAPLVADRSKLLELQREAVALALTIQDETYRSFALGLVDELVRSSGASRRQWVDGQGKTRLMVREAPLWRQCEHPANQKHL